MRYSPSLWAKGCPSTFPTLELGKICVSSAITHTYENKAEVFTELHAYFLVCQTLPVCGLLFDCKF